MSEFRKLSEFTDGYNRTGQVYLTEGNSRYMVLLYEAQSDYNEAMFFDNEDDADDCAEDWVMIK
jgi:hypothetical protein